jgi:hypothetical protein
MLLAWLAVMCSALWGLLLRMQREHRFLAVRAGDAVSLAALFLGVGMMGDVAGRWIVSGPVRGLARRGNGCRHVVCTTAVPVPALSLLPVERPAVEGRGGRPFCVCGALAGVGNGALFFGDVSRPILCAAIPDS